MVLVNFVRVYSYTRENRDEGTIRKYQTESDVPYTQIEQKLTGEVSACQVAHGVLCISGGYLMSVLYIHA